MVLGIPLAKAAPLILKIVTKPLVETLKKEARKGSRWNNLVVLPLARYYNKLSLRMRLYSQGLQRNKEQIERSARMSDEAALDLGAELVANTATLGIGLVAIIIGQSLAASAEKEKKAQQAEVEREQQEKIEELENKVLELGFAYSKLDTQYRGLERTVLFMKGYNEVSTKEKSPEDPGEKGPEVPEENNPEDEEIIDPEPES